MAEARKPRSTSSRTSSSGASKAPARGRSTRKTAAGKSGTAKKATSASKSSAQKKTTASRSTAKKTTSAKASTQKKAAASRGPAKKATAAKRSPAKKATPAAKSKPRAAAKTQAGKKAPSRPPVNQPSAAAKKRGGSGNGSGPDNRGDLPSAPSLGPNTVIEREPVEERLARHEQSTVDAMGHDKRRSVVGNSYGPSFAKQATLYGIALAVVVALGIGGKILVDQMDEPPATNPDEAPWSAPDAKQQAPDPLE